VETPTFIPFSAYRELFRIFTFNTPAFLLIFYLLNGKSFYKKPAISTALGLRVLSTFFIILPILCAVSFCMSAASGLFSVSSPILEKPSRALEWLALSVSCLTTGLLEEAFFRLYLPKRLSESAAGSEKAFLFSTALFAFSHLYEGPLGVANAFISGLFLCITFAKTKSLAGVSLAHGVYNLLVYVMA
jgi:membrane protease YdiL (CAAX protease family)